MVEEPNYETIEALEAAERGEGKIIPGVGRVYIDEDGNLLISDCYYCPKGPPGTSGIIANKDKTDIKSSLKRKFRNKY